MVSIGKIRIRRIIDHHLIPPTYVPIVQGPSFASQLSEAIAKHPLLTVMQGTGGGVTPPIPGKHIQRGITQNVTQSSSVTRLKTAGLVGVSFTQLSFTFQSFTVAGIAVTKAITEIITIGDGSVTRSTKIRRIIEPEIEAIESGGTVSSLSQKTRAITEGITIAESVILDTAVLRPLSESVTVSEGVTIQTQKSRVLHPENIGVEDILALELKGQKLLSESVSLSDSVAIVVVRPGTHITRPLTETVTVAENLARQRSIAQALTEIVTIIEDLANEVVTILASYSAASYTQASYTTIIRNEKALTETVDTSDTVRIQTEKKRAITESVNITEALERITTHAAPADNVVVSDQVARQTAKTRSLSQSVTMTDSVNEIVTPSYGDDVVITDQVTRQVTKSRGLSQSVTVVG